MAQSCHDGRAPDQRDATSCPAILSDMMPNHLHFRPVTERLRANASELAHILLSAIPSTITRGEAYRRVRRAISRQPARFQSLPRQVPTARDKVPAWRGRKLVTTDTDLVIEGFPGSANSFVASAVRAAIDRPANVESHFHQTVQLARAIALGVPAVVVVRAPRAACQSLKSKLPALFDPLIILRWLQYHRCVRRHLGNDHFDVVLFDDVIRDVDLVRRRSARVRRLAGRPLVADPSLRRASAEHAPFGEGFFTERLLVAADQLYRQIVTHVEEPSTAASCSPTE